MLPGFDCENKWENQGRYYVAYKAKQLWEEAGKPEGRDLEFWLKAEEILVPICPQHGVKMVYESSRGERGDWWSCPQDKNCDIITEMHPFFNEDIGYHWPKYRIAN